MKTIQEIAVEFAARSGHSYTNVEKFIPHNWVIEAMQEYAKQTAIVQREACYKSVKGVNYNPVSEHIFDSILNTKLVVD